MTKPNIPEIEKQLDGITPGEWEAHPEYCCVNSLENDEIEIALTGSFNKESGDWDGFTKNSKVDAAFIASAPSTIRSLIAYIKELEAENGQHVAKILHLENNARKMIAEREKYDPNPNLTF